MNMNRREFLGLLGKGAVVVGAGGLIVPAAKKIWQVPVQLGNVVVGPPGKAQWLYQTHGKGGPRYLGEWDGYDGVALFQSDHHFSKNKPLHEPISLSEERFVMSAGDILDMGGDTPSIYMTNKAVKEMLEDFTESLGRRLYS